VAGPYSKIRKISSSYFSHDPGEIFALFNSLGLLEIAVYQGNMAVLENIDTSTEIKIRFENSY
jgi:S-adenosylmethionine hydrolase